MDLLFYLALIPALGVAAQWIAWRTNLPGILLLLVFGVGLGSVIRPDEFIAELTGGEAETAGLGILFPLVAMSVAVIMFEGGLSLKLSELREAGAAALCLCTVGAMITWIGASLSAIYCLGFSPEIAALLGAILTVTGPTVIGPLLRQVQPSRRVSATLKWEGIVIDPIGAILAVMVFELMLHQEQSGVDMVVVLLGKTLVVGLVLGLLGGWILSQAFKRFIIPDGLHGAAALSVGLLLFAVSDQLAHESGLITVTVLGMWITNQHGFDVEHIIEFKENLRTLLIGCLFVVLGSRVELSDVMAIGLPGIIFLLSLILIVRPIAAFVSLISSKLDFRERVFVASMAPRGIVAAAVSSVFALKLEEQAANGAMAGSDQLATVTFLVIVGTVAVYGLSAAPIAKWLGLADDRNSGLLIAGADTWVIDLAQAFHDEKIPVVVVDTNYAKISQAKQRGLNALCMNVLNEVARDELPLAGVGNFLAMTSNDEVNSLMTREFRSQFGRSNTYQLSFNAKNLSGRRGLTKHLMGRELFDSDHKFTTMRELHQMGGKFKATKLSDEFTFEDFSDRYKESAIPIAIVNDELEVTLGTVDKPLQPGAGDTVIAFVSSEPIPSSPKNQTT
ncbi:MAG: sodium:proton antiporter [Planctomycetota bacterium]